MAEGIDIEGLPELVRAVKKIQDDLPKQADDATADIARDWVARAQSVAHPAQQTRAAQSLMVNDAGDGATIASHLPWFNGAEFGGGARRTTQQFPTFRGGRGYFFYPSQDDQKAMDQLGKAVDQAFEPWDNSKMGGLF